MNEVFILGKIEDIKFEFMYDSKYISIGIISLKLQNQSIIEAYGYNEIADELIQNFHKGDIVFVYGNLKSDGGIEIRQIEHFSV